MKRLVVLLAAVLAAGCSGPDPAESLSDAQNAFSRGEYPTAVIHLQNVLAADAQSVDARILLGRIALQYGNPAQARGYLESARDLGGSPEIIALLLAESHVMAGDGPSALEQLESLGQESSSAEYWLLRAAAHTQASEYDQAGLALDRAESIVGTSARVALGRARLAAIGGDHTTAEDLLALAIEQDLTAPEGYLLRAGLRVASARLEDAAQDLSVAADIYQDSLRPLLAAQAIMRLVQVQLALDRLTEAEASARRLGQLLPSGAFGAYAEALVAYRQGEFERTVQLMRGAVNEAPEQVQFLTLLGAANMAVGNFGQAEQQFLAILAQNPNDPAAFRLLAEVRIRQQRPAAALDALQQLDVGQQDADVGLLTLQGAAYLQNDEPEQAIPYLEQALGIDPTNQPVTLQLAQALIAVGRDEEADELIRSAPGIDASIIYARNLGAVLAQIQAGDLDAAEEIVEQVLAERPDGAGAHLLAAVFHQLTNDPVAAKERLATALDLDEAYIPARLVLADLLAEEGLLEEAERQLTLVTEFEPASVPAWMGLARLAIENDDLQRAEFLLVTAAERSGSVIPRTVLARFYLGRGDLVAARDELTAAIAVSPDLPDVLVTRAMVALAEGDAQEAADVLSDVAAELPNRPNVALMLARAHIASGNAVAARTSLTEAVARMPGILSLAAGLGAAELASGDVAAASRTARELQNDYPDQAAGFALEAEIRAAGRDYAEAARMYALAYDRGRRWDLLANLVSTLRLSNAAGGEETLLREWLDEAPGDVRARLFLGELLQGAGNATMAYAEFQRVIEIDSSNVMALNNAAWLAHELGRPEALEYALRARELSPDNAAVLDTAGWILAQEGREAEGLEFLRRATELSPETPEIRYHLGFAQARLGQASAARATLQPLLEGQADAEIQASARALLETL